MPANMPQNPQSSRPIAKIQPVKVPASQARPGGPPAAPPPQETPEDALRRGENMEFEPPTAIVRQGLLITLVFFLITVIGICYFQITEGIIAPGKIKIESERKIVQHLEGGIIEKILVREGEEVEAGQPLLVLESVAVDANANILQKRSFDLSARRERLAAEKDMLDKLAWPEEISLLARRLDALQVLANEEKVFATRRKSLDTQVSLLKNQLAQLQAQVAGMREQLHAENAILAALTEEVGAKRRLFNEKFLEKSQILQLEREIATHRGNRGRLEESMAQARQKAAELDLRLKDLAGRYVETATTDLARTENDLAQVKEQTRPLADARKRLQITAPVAGRVVDMKVHSPGGVVRSGETLMEIVPSDNPLIIETRIPVDKITEVYVGQPAMVQLDAFNTSITPHVPGKVTYVSADRLEDAQYPGHQEAYYLCYVQVEPEGLEKYGLYLLPGMPAAVFITARSRLIIHHFLDPVIRAWNRALRD